MRDYKYGKTGPIFEFGHGLSYTTFEYTRLQLPRTISKGSGIDISLEVTNTGAFAGDEVVLLFVNDVVSSVTTPARELKDFARIHLEPGQKLPVQFSLNPNQLAFYNVNMYRVVEPGMFEVMVGGLKQRFEALP